MDATTKKIFECGIIPVIKLEDSADAVPLCTALKEGGIDVAEVTFRTDAAEESIRLISQNMPDVFVGAGTVTSVDLVKKAVDAGAKFIVSPGLNPKVVGYCVDNGIPVFPGISTPSDIEVGLEFGLKVLKFFPAEANGGIKALKAMAAPYGSVSFMPTGGIDAANLLDYLSFDKIIACGGSWMVKEDLVKAKKFDEIKKLTAEAVAKMHNFQFFHMGVNNESKEDAIENAKKFNCLFNIPQRETSASVFAGTGIELMFSKAPGDFGHIGIKTTNVARAMAYLSKKGVEFNFDTLRGTMEKPTFIYLKEQIAGFAVHILQ